MKQGNTGRGETLAALLPSAGVEGVSIGGGSGGGGVSGPAAKRCPLSPCGIMGSSGKSTAFQLAPVTKLPLYRSPKKKLGIGTSKGEPQKRASM